MPNAFSLDRSLRKVFPSISKLTYNSFFKTLVNASDLPSRLVFREFRKLPPNHMRIRVGVANRLFTNQLNHLAAPMSFWLEAFSAGYVRMDSTIVDIGSGCGRYAHVLRDYMSPSGGFTGTYIGVDIDEEMIRWCKANFDPERFRFLMSTDASASYNKATSVRQPYRIPEEDGIADFVFSRSLFTHLLEEQAGNYFIESYRLLRPGGWINHSVFCLDYPPPTLGKRHTFSHGIGNAHVESLAQPEAAVAYTESFLLQLAAKSGFVDAKINHRPGGWQPSFVARKP